MKEFIVIEVPTIVVYFTTSWHDWSAMWESAKDVHTFSATEGGMDMTAPTARVDGARDVLTFSDAEGGMDMTAPTAQVVGAKDV